MFLIKLFKKLFSRFSKVNYIYSNTMLPAPLEKDKERELLIKRDEGSKEALDTLIEHNLRLVVYIAKKFDVYKVQLEDLISIGSMGLMKGVKTFKPEKNIKLATYASRCIENEILMHLRKVSKLKNEVSIDDALNVDSEGNELLLFDVLESDEEGIEEILKKAEEKKLMYEAISNLNDREKEILTLRYGLNNKKPLTQKEVAELLVISQSYISRLEKKIIDKMRHDISKKYEYNLV